MSHFDLVRNGLKCVSKAKGVHSMRDVYSALADPTCRRLLRMSRAVRPSRYNSSYNRLR